MDQERANLAVARANELHAAGRYAEAVVVYGEAVDAFPPYVSFNLVVGDMLTDLGRHREAVDAYRSVVEAHPDHDQAWAGLGRALLRCGLIPEAKEALDRAGSLDPDTIHLPGDPDLLIGLYRGATGIDDRAAAILVLAKSGDPSAPAVLHEWIRYASGHLHKTLDFAVWESLAVSLEALGWVGDSRIYHEWRGPDIEALRADVPVYLEAHPNPPERPGDLPREKRRPRFWKRKR